MMTDSNHPWTARAAVFTPREISAPLRKDRLAPRGIAALATCAALASCSMSEPPVTDEVADPTAALTGIADTRPIAPGDPCAAPALSTVLQAVPSSSGGAAPIDVTLHYLRPDGDYAGWGLHVWQLDAGGQFIADYPGVTWPAPLSPTGFDTDGAVFHVEAAKITDPRAAGIGFIVHRGDTKDPDPDRQWQFARGGALWLRSGDATIYADAAGTPAPDLPPASIASTTDARAVWLTASVLRWPGAAPSGRFRLYHARAGQIVARQGAHVTGADGALGLAPNTAPLPAAVAERFRWVATGVDLALSEPAALDHILTSQLVVVQEDAAGAVLAATTAQLAGLLDDRFARAAQVTDFGVTPRRDRTGFRVWAPTARSVALCVHGGPDHAAQRSVAMTRDPRTGVWSVALAGDLTGQYYRYAVEVFVRGVGVVSNLVTDPYSISLDADSRHSYIAALDASALAPPGWSRDAAPDTVPRQEDMTIYELHVRDFSASDASVPPGHRGKFLAFTDDSDGMRHLRGLARAGLTDVHLLPVFDLATVPERGCVTPVIPNAGPDSEAQQAAIMAVADQDCFNWGYDPFHYTAPEGSYSTRPDDGASRIREMRQMVAALHTAGLRVGMDVVYNHTTASGQLDRSVLDRIVPGYYHRLDASGEVTRSTCCDNTAAENLMMGKLMIDSVVTWATAYHIDSFRFDLMSFHPRATMQALKAAVDAATGRSIHLLGEGWNFGEVADGARFVQASQLSLGGSGIATFSDRARDSIRGGGPFDSGVSLLQNQGFVTGLFYDDNGSGGGHTRDDLLRAADLVRVGLAGSLRDYRLVTATGQVRALSEIDYNGQPAGYVTDPQEVVNYVENHDNQTLFDIAVYKLPRHTPTPDRARVQLLAAALDAFSQGVAYFHAGIDTLRSKSMDRNSFNSGDWFNRLDWTYRTNNFAVGLPPAADNAESWPVMRPLLADPGIQPRPADIQWMRDAFRDLLEIRHSSRLFHLRSAAEVSRRLTFYNTGTAQEPTVIAGHLDGRGYPRAGSDDLIYFVNVDTVARTVTIPTQRHKAYRLHPVHRRDDATDRRPSTASRYDRATGAFTIPPRTALVYVTD